MTEAGLLHSDLIALIKRPTVQQLHKFSKRQFGIVQNAVDPYRLFMSFGTFKDVTVPVLAIDP